MLSKLRVQNFALMESAEVYFSRGLVIISGETGSGKSILVNAINFMLGERADKNAIRHGTSFCQVEGVFELERQEDLSDVFAQLGMESDPTLIICRKLFADGRGEIRINGQTVNLTMLKSITAKLVDLYGQHEHQTLLNVGGHLGMLDDFNPPPGLDELGALIEKIGEIDAHLEGLGGDSGLREREKDILKFELEELDGAELIPGEEDELALKMLKFRNAQKLTEAISSAHSNLAGEGENALALLANSEKMLHTVAALDKKLEELFSRLAEVRVELVDISDSLLSSLDAEFSAAEFEQIDKRLDLLKNIKRKYGGTIEKAIEYQNNSRLRLDELENSQALIEELEAKRAALIGEGERLCGEIRQARMKNAEKMQQQIVSELAQLGMKNANFVVEFTQLEKFNKTGADEVHFLFSANKGEPLKPLTKVISGGEMSRFMLAFKTVMGEKQSVSTMIFDEIDNGIGGEIGLVVGKKLVSIAQGSQVLVVTHLASIGAMADQHLCVKKETRGENTISEVHQLSDQEKLVEIARLAGGHVDEVALQYAAELKAYALKVREG